MVREIAFGLVVALVAAGAQAQNSLQGTVELEPASKSERDAGVWVDGQYVGFVSDLRGNNRLVLVPGRHELLFKLIGYENLMATVTVEPGHKSRYRVAMEPKAGLTYPSREDTARVRISVEPSDAAIFVNETFVGHVDRFDGRNGMRLAPGTYRFTIALPGYAPFETQLSLRAGQTYEVRTELPRGSLSDQAAELLATNPGVLSAND